MNIPAQSPDCCGARCADHKLGSGKSGIRGACWFLARHEKVRVFVLNPSVRRVASVGRSRTGVGRCRAVSPIEEFLDDPTRDEIM